MSWRSEAIYCYLKSSREAVILRDRCPRRAGGVAIRVTPGHGRPLISRVSAEVHGQASQSTSSARICTRPREHLSISVAEAVSRPSIPYPTPTRIDGIASAPRNRMSAQEPAHAVQCRAETLEDSPCAGVVAIVL